MRTDDIPQVAALDHLSFADPWPQGSFEYELKANNYSLCLVAEDPGAVEGQNIVGALVIWLIVDEAHIATIAVHPGYRHRGIGRSLLAEGLLQAADRGAVKSYWRYAQVTLTLSTFIMALVTKLSACAPIITQPSKRTLSCWIWTRWKWNF